MVGMRALLLTLALGLGACDAATVSPGTSGPATPGPTAAAPTPEPIASDALGEFSCELPVVEQATQPAVTNIVDVRIGMHDGYDRVVFEFTAGTPELTLDRATPPFTQDGSGQPVEAEGQSFLVLVMRGGTKQTEDGTSSYDGPTDFDPRFSQLVDLIEGGDFEAQSTWYLGLREEACVRLSLLTGPDRIVIDVEH
jgi:hypothetical protein